MEQEILQPYDVDLEDGELSNDSNESYTLLTRPTAAAAASHSGGSSLASAAVAVVASSNTDGGEERSPLATCHQMQTALDDEIASDADSSNDYSLGSSSSDMCLKKCAADGDGGNTMNKRNRRKRVRRAVMLRVPPAPETQEMRARFKKYMVWTAALQEETLTENMRECDVARSGVNDRNVENYDYKVRYRLNGENSLKRRLSNSTDDFSDGELPPSSKRGRPSRVSNDAHNRRSVKSRLGHRFRGRSGSTPTSGSDNSCDVPRHILSLDEPNGRDPLDVAREMANKLSEEKDELMVRIVEILGTDIPVELYKETQRIEADGGMMIKNGKRRRTPGGVFLFLLKHDDRISEEQHKTIFAEDRKNTNQWLKGAKAMSRDRKVEELKKRLSEKDKRLAALNSGSGNGGATRKNNLLLGSDLSLEHHQATSLSNPPPSPVGQEQSPDYHAINHVISANDASGVSEKATTSAAAALVGTNEPLDRDDCGLTYDDDFLDINCGEMDMF